MGQGIKSKYEMDIPVKKRTRTKPSNGKGRDFIVREVWLAEAYKTLIERGIDNVKVLNLANNLGVTRGSFYWRYKSRKELLEELIKLWQRTNTSALNDAANLRFDTLAEWYVNIMLVWLDKTRFDVKLDIAIRDWARKDKTVLTLVEKEDNLRIERIQQAFQDIGDFNSRLAFTRARVLYYTQMGYYMLGNQDPPELRAGYLLEYCSILTGDAINSMDAEKYINEFLPLTSNVPNHV